MSYERKTTDRQLKRARSGHLTYAVFLSLVRDLQACEAENAANFDAFTLLRRAVSTQLCERCKIQGVTHSDVVTYAANEIDRLRRESSPDWMRAERDQAVAESERLRKEIERLRGELADMYRIHKLRGEALQRPCIHCGYQPKVIVAMDATSAPRAEGGGWPQENDHASM